MGYGYLLELHIQFSSLSLFGTNLVQYSMIKLVVPHSTCITLYFPNYQFEVIFCSVTVSM